MAEPLRILLLEDDAHDAEVIEQCLRDAGFELVIRRVAAESAFRSEVGEGRHEVVLASFHVPGVDGLEALKTVRKTAPDLPFILVSRSIGEERAIEAFLEGAADFVLKDRLGRLPAAVAAALAKKAQRKQALAESEQRFDLVAQATRDVIWDWTIDHDTLWVNDALRTEWGYERHGLYVSHQSWSGCIHPDDARRVAESLKAAIEGTDERWAAEYRFRRADGSYGFVFDRRAIIRDANGHAVRIIGTMQNVSVRKASELRAVDAERLAHLGHWTYDLVTGRREWSSEMYRMFDIEPGQSIVNGAILDRVHPDDRHKLIAAWSRDAQSSSDFDLRVIDRAGKLHTIEMRLEREVDEAGAVVRILGTAQDVTDRVESERRIRELSGVNELVLRNAAEGIIAVGALGDVLFANPAAERMLEWDNGKEIRDLHRALHPHEESASGCTLANDLRSATSRVADSQFFTRRGEWFDVRYTCGAIVEGGRVTGSVLTFANTSELKHLERQLEQVQRVNSLGRIAATIAHEFNNVLMGIQPFAEIIRNRAAEERMQQAGTQILASVARGRRITQDILRTTQLAEPEIVPVDLRAWVAQLEPEIAAVVGQAVTVRVNRPEEPLFAMLDPAQMQQVLTNLAANARDAMPRGGELTLTIEPATRGSQRMVRLVVSDTGHGIPADVLPLIFEPLFTTKRTGTGLGLAVVQQLLNRNGGSIDVASEPGKGTTFTILVPATEQRSPGPVVKETASSPVGKLLLVEDDRAVSEGMVALLEMEGIKVCVVERGRDAVKAMEEFGAHAAVIDYGLPDMSGADVYDLLAQRWPNLPVVFATGHGDAADLARQLAHPSVRLLRKPYDIDLLLATLREIV
ncbi:MAG: response regulator [Thermoanaerobaculia bacterium]